MPAYLVRWEIELDAPSPREAVALAVSMLPVAGNDSTATFFDVRDPADESLIEQIDLSHGASLT